jgi:hypothetical protein
MMSNRNIVEERRRRLWEDARAVFDEELRALQGQAAKDLLKELGLDDVDVEDLPLVFETQEFEDYLDTLADEVANRTVGHVMEQRTASHEGESGKKHAIAVLTIATMAAIAAKAVPHAFNKGREAVIDLVVKVHAEDVIIATRTAVMDRNTCGPCAQLHGTSYRYGSANYYDKKPPAYCQGLSRCRCVMTYQLPVTLTAS